MSNILSATSNSSRVPQDAHEAARHLDEFEVNDDISPGFNGEFKKRFGIQLEVKPIGFRTIVLDVQRMVQQYFRSLLEGEDILLQSPGPSFAWSDRPGSAHFVLIQGTFSQIRIETAK